MEKVFAHPDAIRAAFSSALSQMYRAEVPLYGDLLEIVASVNRKSASGGCASAPTAADTRLEVERHGAIRLGTPSELRMIRRVFGLMGMFPVDYYDLSAAGVPVHSTAFRPLTADALNANPFRVFTSLLRLDLITDRDTRALAAEILARRDIFTPKLHTLLDQAEERGNLTDDEAGSFVDELLETFRWHGEALVDIATYRKLHEAHSLIADVVCFRGPHINHLTPRTLDIDEAQAMMHERSLQPKAVIEGPPRRDVPILLRQTSFRALSETISFPAGGGPTDGTHTARFGEIEQRGVALRPAGRALYDRLLADAETDPATDHAARLASAFTAFPDDLESLRRQGLAYVRYAITYEGQIAASKDLIDADGVTAGLEKMISSKWVAIEPVLYEDFLPVSAAGIFRSNLDGAASVGSVGQDSRDAFETALGTKVCDPFDLYEDVERSSLRNLAEAISAASSARTQSI